MARLIPDLLDRDDTPSPGERLIFSFFEDAPGTEDWVVFHSLRLARVRGKPMGEIDFAILVPDLGILILEVKASKRITHRNGSWYYGSQPNPGKDPFKQAADAMYALKNAIEQRFPEYKNEILFTHAVAFTHVNFEMNSLEWRHSQIIDATSMNPLALVDSITRALSSEASHLRHAFKKQNSRHYKSPALPPQFIPHLVKFLQPEFEAVLNPSSILKLHEDKLLRLTEEQFYALDQMRLNRRVIFEGPAGTGKTLLAVEAARRALDQGERVLLVCHNRELGKHLQSALENRLNPESFVGTIHSFFLHYLKISPPKNRTDLREFFATTLQELMIDSLTSHEPRHASSKDLEFDLIIIDELQDLTEGLYLDIINSIQLHGSDTRLYGFGDIENQAFFRNISPEEVRQKIINTLGDSVVSLLSINCRNPEPLVNLVNLLVEISPPYTKALNKNSDFRPRLEFFAGSEEDRLIQVLSELESNNLLSIGTTVLSLSSEQESTASNINHSMWKARLSPIGQPQNRQTIPYASVFRFKGLESPIVVVTDITEEHLTTNSEELYVALTRSTLATIIIIEEKNSTLFHNRIMSMTKLRGGQEYG